MDDFDIKLLLNLQQDGRLTNNELADRIGLSASQCSRRRTALEASGVIERYQAVLSSERLGVGVVAFVHVTLTEQSPANAEKFLTLLSTLEEVQEVYSMTGESDYFIKLSVPTPVDLSRILNDRLLSHATVARVRSSVALDRFKQTNSLPLRHLYGSENRRIRPLARSLPRTSRH